MNFCSLYSGSSGNALYVEHCGTNLLIDAGLSGKKIEAAMREIDRFPEHLSGILVTHEHRDHINGIGILSRRFHLPIYANQPTWEAIKKDIGRVEATVIFETGTEFNINDLKINSFSVSHDAAEPVGFVINDDNRKIGILTDTGIFTSGMLDALKDCQLTVIESNHDEGMVESGPYPYSLKRRILSSYGHLSNRSAAQLACELVKAGNIKHIVLAHLSEQNNYPYLANQTTESALSTLSNTAGISLEVAKRNRCSHFYKL